MRFCKNRRKTLLNLGEQLQLEGSLLNKKFHLHCFKASMISAQGDLKKKQLLLKITTPYNSEEYHKLE